MKKWLIRAYVLLKEVSIYVVLGYLIFNSIFSSLPSASVTSLNTTSSLLAFTVGFAIVMGGAMANDSGAGGFFIRLLQVSTLTYHLVYFIGLISSISVLYSDMENKQVIAKWLASMSLIQLAFIIVLLAVGLLYEKYEKFQRDKR